MFPGGALNEAGEAFLSRWMGEPNYTKWTELWKDRQLQQSTTVDFIAWLLYLADLHVKKRLTIADDEDDEMMPDDVLEEVQHETVGQDDSVDAEEDWLAAHSVQDTVFTSASSPLLPPSTTTATNITSSQPASSATATSVVTATLQRQNKITAVTTQLNKVVTKQAAVKLEPREDAIPVARASVSELSSEPPIVTINNNIDKTECSKNKPTSTAPRNEAAGIIAVEQLGQEEMIESQLYHCVACGKSFDTEKNLAAHAERHHRADHCSRPDNTSSRASRENHHVHHAKGDDNSYDDDDDEVMEVVGDFGASVFPTATQQSIFSPLASSQNNVECDESDQAAADLPVSARRRGGRPVLPAKTDPSLHSCHYCDYSSRFSSALKQHVLAKHARGKSFVCEECGYSTEWKANLKKHQMRHFNLRPFACHVCSFSSNYSQSLRKHVETMHPGTVGPPITGAGQQEWYQAGAAASANNSITDAASGSGGEAATIDQHNATAFF